MVSLEQRRSWVHLDLGSVLIFQFQALLLDIQKRTSASHDVMISNFRWFEESRCRRLIDLHNVHIPHDVAY